ncbi:MAG: hypothetical protein C0599_08055 [Salinivirgaceae bacterium]|nr:MAG: hypothetical protein C0599_08055 [Salinivirgaceae bacterium]
MGSHPINLTLRFLLETAALVFVGIWGWTTANNDFKYIQAIFIPIFMAILWGIFAVPGDPSRSGRAPVPIKGYARLILEILFFGFASWCIFDTGRNILCVVIASLIVFHYIISYDRIIWLFKH